MEKHAKLPDSSSADLPEMNPKSDGSSTVVVTVQMKHGKDQALICWANEEHAWTARSTDQ